MNLGNGLANQMFMYAAGYALAKRINAKLKIVVTNTNYALDAFGINANVETITSHLILELQRRLRRPFRFIYCMFRTALMIKYRLPVKTHRAFYFWEGFNEIDRSCYLSGNWQSEMYFLQVADEIADIFALDRFSSAETREIENTITSAENAIGVHIRLGDYVNNSWDLGVSSGSYYRRARTMMEKIVSNPTFFVFSDDIQTAKERLRGWDNTTFVSGYSKEQDMMLMSKCKHNIIANSTFSWWAAWLNQNQTKVVIAPRMWFPKKIMRIRNTIDICPDEWILL